MSKDGKEDQMAHQKEEEEESLREAFDILDQDKDGYICVDEINRALRAVGLNPTDNESDEIKKKSTGKIDFDEFKECVKETKKRHGGDEKKLLTEAFKIFDTDGNGFIETHELKTIMENLNHPATDDEIKYMIMVADVNGDGKINHKELVDFIMGN